MMLHRLDSWAMELDNKPDRDETDEQVINSIQAARDSTEDILEWWKRHDCIFPNIAAMAKGFLATPA
ncbi:unnamed protein product, partial [Callosobruchus maculatus]